MTPNAIIDSVTFLTYTQLIEAAALARSISDTRFRAYIANADAALVAIENGEPAAEFIADMPGLRASWREQADLCNAIADEICKRGQEGNYA